MGTVEGNQETRTNKVFSYKEARLYTKFMNSKPTTNQLCWRDIKTGGTVAFIGI